MFKPVNKNNNLNSLAQWCVFCDKKDNNCTICDGGFFDMWGYPN